MDYQVAAGGALKGRLRVAGDKSISHRSVMLGSLAEGVTHVTGLLEGEDVLCTLAAFRTMGVLAKGPEHGRLTIQGVGLHGLRPPAQPLDMGNSGTAMRLMAGILAGQAFDSVLIGDESLSKRPMKRVSGPLGEMGARIDTNEGGRPPLRIHGGRLDLRSRAQGELVGALLDVVDDLGRVAHLDPAATAASDVIAGVELVERKLLRVLAGAGLERVTEADVAFDPNQHEAIGTVPADHPELDHTVGLVAQVGYRFGGQLLRPARVLVRVWPADTGDTNAGPDGA